MATKPAIGFDVFELIHAHQVADNEMRQNLIESLMAERDQLRTERDHFERCATLFANALDDLDFARAVYSGRWRGDS